jgi:hydroxymethylpyrimidine/phosphomethylpyrimidine kinase
MISNVLSIAGSDPSGGAGIQADLKVFSAMKVYGMAVITALTAQNTTGVSEVMALDKGFVAEQIKMVFADIEVHAVKIGMIANADIASSVADTLSAVCNVPVILDPVMIAKGGSHLLTPDAVQTLRGKLVPIAEIITPNLPEAAALLDCDEATSIDEMMDQANMLLALGPKTVYLKGGHLRGRDSPDILMSTDHIETLEGIRIDTKNTHGTGCSLSAALAACRGRNLEMIEAAKESKEFISQAITFSDRMNVGQGHGPIHHFHAFW